MTDETFRVVVTTVGSVLTVAIPGLIGLAIANMSKINKVKINQDALHTKIDGLLEEKTKADIKIGEKKATDAMDKTAADIQTGVDQGVKQEKNDQANRDLPPK